jgi:flagellar motor switch protein FliN/FliY
MSDGSLSQDEIDALLQGTESIDMDPAAAASALLGDEEKAQLQSLVQDASETQSSTLSVLTGKTVEIGKPLVELKSREQLEAELEDEVVDVRIDFTEGLVGEHSYLMSTGAATIIAGAMMGQQVTELDEATLSAVAEALSQITGPLTTAVGNRAGTTIRMSPADAQKVPRGQVRYPAGEVFVKLAFPLSIDGESSSELFELLSLAAAKEMLGLLGGAAGVPVGATAAPAAAPRARNGGAILGAGSQAAAVAQPFGAFGQTAAAQPQRAAFAGPLNPSTVQPVQFASLTAGPESSDRGNIGLLMDVSMDLTVELGRTRQPIKQILEMGEGTIIELDKLAGEPVDILVNHKLIAKGEVVVIDENFGVRVTEIVSGLEKREMS